MNADDLLRRALIALTTSSLSHTETYQLADEINDYIVRGVRMPRFTIDLTPDQLLSLQAEIELHNMQNGTEHTVASFLQEHARERAIARHLNNEAVKLQEEQRSALAALRQRLIAGDAPPAPKGETR